MAKQLWYDFGLDKGGDIFTLHRDSLFGRQGAGHVLRAEPLLRTVRRTLPARLRPAAKALGASRTAAPCTEGVSRIRPPEVPPIKCGESPLVQFRQCGTVRFRHRRIRGKSSVYG